jgi:hypothetical protein
MRWDWIMWENYMQIENNIETVTNKRRHQDVSWIQVAQNRAPEADVRALFWRGILTERQSAYHWAHWRTSNSLDFYTLGPNNGQYIGYPALHFSRVSSVPQIIINTVSSLVTTASFQIISISSPSNHVNCDTIESSYWQSCKIGHDIEIPRSKQLGARREQTFEQHMSRHVMFVVDVQRITDIVCSYDVYCWRAMSLDIGDFKVEKSVLFLMDIRRPRANNCCNLTTSYPL